MPKTSFATEKYPDLKTLSKEGVKLLIFDLDGTLLDSMSVWNDVDVVPDGHGVQERSVEIEYEKFNALV